MTEENASQAHEPTETGMSRRRFLVLLSAGIIVPVVLSLLAVFVLEPFLVRRDAAGMLDQLTGMRGSITVSNDKAVVYAGQRAEGANVNQKALSADGSSSSAPTVIFTNGKEASGKKRIEVFFDFESQRARDFLLINSGQLKGLVEGGVADLYVYPVPNGKAYSIYAAEALFESAYLYPDRTWDFLRALLKGYLTATNTDKNADVLNAVAKVASESGVPEVNAAGIKNGTFSGWSLTVGNDKRLADGFSLPLIYIDGSVVDQDDVNINDPDALRKAVTG